MIPTIWPRVARVQGLGGVPTGRLRAALAWAHRRASRTGTFPATLLADRLQVPAVEATTLLNVLALLGLCDRYETGGGRVYACGPLLAAAPAADAAIRPQETILPRELWAAVSDAQARTGLASTETVAEFLDAPAGRVDRVDVALRLVTLAVRGLLTLGPDRGAARRGWQMSRIGAEQARMLLERGLTDHEVWTVIAAGSPNVDLDVDLATAARRLGISWERVDGWADRQTRNGHLTRVGTTLRLAASGWEAINAAGWKDPAR
ncbi:hypothetical protein [Frankia gtarii]|uniref:hypothetical protein n=1 Tax=Frankia gtarii TaxID=2950102 RepID=UPI0021BFC50A|nr:hypothetical protein [Frankia gtarii]